MDYYCVFCKKRLIRRQRKYCSNSCKCRQFYKVYPERCGLWNKRNPKPKVENKCLTCDEDCGRKRYCSPICKPIRLRQKVYWKYIERFNATCRICEGTIFVAHVHHINGNHLDNKKENLLIVCPSCHTKIHFPKKKIVPRKKRADIEKRLMYYRGFLTQRNN